MFRQYVHLDESTTTAEVARIGRETAEGDPRPCYCAPEPIAHIRRLYVAWLRGYSAAAAARWPGKAVVVG